MSPFFLWQVVIAKKTLTSWKITTNYAPVLLEFLENQESSGLDYEDFRIVIPMSEIVSARIFDPDMYELFQQEGSSE